ncbi:MAG TPA: hypothetical protein PKC24_06295 [Cyclobacteriaceae bacterium]|nr:hypothetical protein [Cyclobacteriaceae bacterium]
MDIVTRKQLNILIQLAEADKHFASVERELIYALAKKKKFPEHELNELIKKPEPIESLGALSIAQKLDYLFTCAHLILADQKVFEAEINFAKNIAIKLGFKQSAINYLIDNWENTPEEELKSQLLEDFM